MQYYLCIYYMEYKKSRLKRTNVPSCDTLIRIEVQCNGIIRHHVELERLE